LSRPRINPTNSYNPECTTLSFVRDFRVRLGFLSGPNKEKLSYDTSSFCRVPWTVAIPQKEEAPFFPGKNMYGIRHFLIRFIPL